jgi:EpsI family protein
VPAPQLANLPSELGDWRALGDIRLDAQTEKTLQADSYLLRTYTRGAAPVTLFVAYYATQRSGHTIHSPLNCLPGTGWEWTERDRETVAAADREIEINRNVAAQHRHQVLVYYWYQSRGRVVASDYLNKLLLVRDALTLHRSDGALVRVTVPVAQGAADEASSFIRAMFSPLAQHLPE